MKVCFGPLFLLLFGVVFPAQARQFQGVNGFQYLDQSVRVDVVRASCSELAKRYAAWEYKKAVIGVDGAKLCREAEKTEALIPDPKDTKSGKTAIRQARLNSEFWDRLQKLGAGFRDTHLTLTPAFNRAKILNGLKTEKIGTQVRVTEAYPDIVRGLLVEPSADLPQAGDELLSVNGVPAMASALQLQPWVSGSSESGRLMESVRSLMARSFRFEAYGPAPRFEFRRFDRKFSIQLRYAFGAYGELSKSVTSTSDAVDLSALGVWPLERVTHQNLVLIPTIFNGRTQQDPLSTPSSARDSKEYLLGDVPVMRLAKIDTRVKTIGYLQLRAFLDRGSSILDPALSVNGAMIDAIAPWLSRLESEGGDLVLDLRFNAGGEEAFLNDFLILLAKPGQKLNPPLIQMRVSSASREDLVRTYSADVQSLLLNDLITDVLLRKQNQAPSLFVPLTQPYRSVAWLMSQNASDGFTGQITVLTGPECVSACESFVRTIKVNHRARLAGENTAGTGVGIRYREQNLMDVLVAQGLAKISLLSSELIGAPQFARLGELKTGLAADYTWAGENRPVPVDVRIEPPRDIPIDQVTDYFMKQLGAQKH